jgi:betaine lipid synthase
MLAVVLNFFKFLYNTFLKFYSIKDGDSGQQAALESFYKDQADAYDSTRTYLLRGREDLLALVAAQLKYRTEQGIFNNRKPTWVDVRYGFVSRPLDLC